jgi:hypothetical protein
MEPLEYMWLQQGLGSSLMFWLEKVSSLTKGRINFTTQEVNQRLALESSFDGKFATLDMKDASDRVSVMLIKRMFRYQPRLLRKLLALRTPSTLLPTGSELSLHKYAGMGSALCFPVESLVFWALSVVAVAMSARPGLPDLKEAARSVYVFGDDIIVPSKYADAVSSRLESVGLVVNRAKSYDKGMFRESCGVDAFFGEDVTPTRFRKLFPASRTDGTGFESWVSYANSFSQRGYHLLSKTIGSELEKLFGPIPYGTRTTSFPCWIVNDPVEAEFLNMGARFRWRVSKDYQRLEFLVKFIKSSDVPTTLDGWARLQRNIIAGPGDEPSQYVEPRTTRVLRGFRPI